MRFASSTLSRLWIIVPLFAAGYIIWAAQIRIARIEHVSSLPGWSVGPAAEDSASPTGYASGKRRLILPLQNNDTHAWVAETQQMFARGEWRVRHVDYDNAPFGREVLKPSPYRWWLGLVAWFDHLISGRSLALSVEQAALHANTVMLILFLVTTTLFVARHFGAFASALAAAALAMLFPLAGGFVPGAPDDADLARVFALWSVLPLAAGIAGRDATTGARRCFIAAGVFGGLGLWTSVAVQVPVTAGILAGAFIATWMGRRTTTAIEGEPPASALPWRAWGLAAGITGMSGWMIEYAPGHLGGLHLEVNHPLYALAWIGAGGLLARFAMRPSPSQEAKRRHPVVALILAIAAVAALPIALFTSPGESFLSAGPAVRQLSTLVPLGADHLADWVYRDGMSGPLLAALLPLLLPGAAAIAITIPSTPVVKRTAITVALCPAVVAFLIACVRLRWWGTVDILLIAPIAVAAVAAGTAGVNTSTLRARLVWSALVFIAAVPGVLQVVPREASRAGSPLAATDVAGLIERDLAHWLTDRAPVKDAIVLTTPDLTTALAYYGGLRGLGTIAEENREGLAAAIRITSARTRDEITTLVQQRKLAYIIIPSWDGFMNEYARLGRGIPPGTPIPESTFIAALNRFALPPWLQPVPYRLQPVPGFEKESVTIFKVNEDQDAAELTSRLAEYFIEMGLPHSALGLTNQLRQYPSDAGALAAVAQVEAAAGNRASFTHTLQTLTPLLERGADRGLAFDRRVSVALVLALGPDPDATRAMLEDCLEQLDADALRSLSIGSLYRFLALCKRMDLEIRDETLRTLALELLPPATRERL